MQTSLATIALTLGCVLATSCATSAPGVREAVPEQDGTDCAVSSFWPPTFTTVRVRGASAQPVWPYRPWGYHMDADGQIRSDLLGIPIGRFDGERLTYGWIVESDSEPIAANRVQMRGLLFYRSFTYSDDCSPRQAALGAAANLALADWARQRHHRH